MSPQDAANLIKVDQIPYSWAKKELTLDKAYTKGDTGPKVKLIQEWLCLHGQQIRLDGDFGPATDAALRQFQKDQGLPENGIVDEATFTALILPMLRVLTPLEVGGRALNDLAVAYAQQHLAENPREIGGDNCGPWVRLYMKGDQGSWARWCAGFVCFVIGQAANSLGLDMPIRPSFSCNELGEEAEGQGLLVSGEDLQQGTLLKSQMPKGCFFLRRHANGDGWGHTGLVTDFCEDTFNTIEGNTNDDGSANGYEACKSVHGYSGYDFIKIT